MHSLVHVEVTFEDPLLHGIGHLGLGHFTNWRLHDCNALGTVVRRASHTQRRRGAGNGSPLGS